jgi:hypothetical protein
MMPARYPPLFLKVFTHPQYSKQHILARNLIQAQKSAPLALFKHIMGKPAANIRSAEYYKEKEIALYSHLEKNVQRYMKYRTSKMGTCHEPVPLGLRRMGPGCYDYEMDGSLRPARVVRDIPRKPTRRRQWELYGGHIFKNDQRQYL